MFLKFLCSGKPDKMNRKTVELENKKGGINMISFQNSIISLKANLGEKVNNKSKL